MAERQNLYRVIKLIRLLNTPPPRSVKQLMEILNTNKNTIYKDIELLRELEYPVEKDDQHRYFFNFQETGRKKSVLTSEELSFLHDRLQQLGGRESLARSILEKFDLNLSLIPLADALPQLQVSRIINLLRTGIELEQTLLLRGYRSLTSHTITDRRVEPLEITEDRRYVIAWDLDKNDQRQFKINRIDDIDFLDQKITAGRTYTPMDLFGLTGDSWKSVKLKLSPTAYHLLTEEFPASLPHIHRVNNEVFFDGMVRNWKGVGRFVLGLPREIDVLEPGEFKDYLNGQTKFF